MIDDALEVRVSWTPGERGTIAPRQYRRGPKPILEDEHFEWIRIRREKSPTCPRVLCSHAATGPSSSSGDAG